MKKVIFALMFVTAFTVMGQQEKKGQKYSDTERKQWTPEQMATLQTKRMTLALDLSKDQQAKIEKLNLENAKRRTAKMEEYKAKKENGEEKQLSSEERFTMANSRLDQQIGSQEELKKILNDEQFEKWQTFKKRDAQRHHKKHGEKGEKRNKSGSRR